MPRHHVFEFLESTPTEPTVAAKVATVSDADARELTSTAAGD